MMFAGMQLTVRRNFKHETLNLEHKTSNKSLITNDLIYVTNEKLDSYAWMVYFKYHNSKLELKAKAIYGQNLSESVMPGGYGISVLDSLTGVEKYTPYNYFYRITPANYT